jgi:hypothetical protein
MKWKECERNVTRCVVVLLYQNLALVTEKYSPCLTQKVNKFTLRKSTATKRKSVTCTVKNVNIVLRPTGSACVQCRTRNVHRNKIFKPIESEKTLDYPIELPGFQEEF